MGDPFGNMPRHVLFTRRNASESDAAAYNRWYTRGWNYSETSPSPTLETGDRNNYPEAWYDGYLDSAAGRPKWHLREQRAKNGGKLG